MSICYYFLNLLRDHKGRNDAFVFSAFFHSCCIPRLENDTALACYTFDAHQPILIIFVANKRVLLSTVCKYYVLPHRFYVTTVLWGLYCKNCRVHVSPGSAETLVRRSGITNHHLIAYCLSKIFANNYQNRLMCVEVSVQRQCRVFETQSDAVNMVCGAFSYACSCSAGVSLFGSWTLSHRKSDSVVCGSNQSL